MRKLLLFNPSNDMALAANLLGYLPPQHIRRMESDLALLPLWWAEEDDCILMPDASVRRVTAGALALLASFVRECHTVGADELAAVHSLLPVVDNVEDALRQYVPVPWGWNMSLRRDLLRLGVVADNMPSDEELAEWRMLSSRAFACDFMADLQRDARAEGWGGSLVGQNMRMATENVFDDASVQSHPLVFKTPWSSSGKGVFVENFGRLLNGNRIDNSIRLFGSVLVDDFYEDKLLDFALEFCINPSSVHEERVEFLGYSVFQASERGHYGHNVVAPQAELERLILATGLDEALLHRVVDYAACHLASMLGGRYYGCLGIDMLVCRHEGRVMLHPCIEINLRRNMGILALNLYSRLSAMGSAVSSSHNILLAGNVLSGFSVVLNDNRLLIDFRK